MLVVPPEQIVLLLLPTVYAVGVVQLKIENDALML
jgi:hypothetical protein